MEWVGLPVCARSCAQLPTLCGAHSCGACSAPKPTHHAGSGHRLASLPSFAHPLPSRPIASSRSLGCRRNALRPHIDDEAHGIQPILPSRVVVCCHALQSRCEVEVHVAAG